MNNEVPEEFLNTWKHLLKLRRGLSFDIETHLLDETMSRCGFLDHTHKQVGQKVFSRKRERH